jgi:hypothetical protein
MEKPSWTYGIDPERRQHTLSIPEEVIEEIAERAAERAITKMESRIYQTVGKTFITKIFQITGIILISIAVYLNQKGIIKL